MNPIEPVTLPLEPNPPSAAYGPGTSQPAPPEKDYGFARPDGAFALLLTVLGFLFVKFVLGGGGGVSVTVYTVLYTASVLGYLRVRKAEIRPAGLACLAVVLVTGAYFGLFGGGPLGVFTLLFLIALSAYAAAALCGACTGSAPLRYVVSDTCAALFVTPFSHFGAGPRAVYRATRGKASRRVLYAVLGVLLAIPLFILVGVLLGSADELFKRMWDSLAGALFNRLPVHAGQFLLGIPVAMYLFGLLYGSLRRRAQSGLEERAEARARSLRVVPLPLALGVVVPLLALYVLFFLSQLPYLTSAFLGVVPEGYTHAEYARRGFFELCGVCSINMAVLLGLYHFTRFEPKGVGFVSSCRPAGVCAVLLCVFSMCLSVISLRKMILYVEHLGLTRKRIYTSVFMIFLFAAFALAIAGLLRKRFAAARWVTLTGTALLLALCFMNADALVARHNISRYQQNKVERLDVMPMRDLGYAAVKPLADLLEAGGLDPALEEDILYVLSGIYDHKHVYANRDWRSMTLVSLQSRGILEGMADRLEEVRLERESLDR